MEKVTFDGPNKLIILSQSVTGADVKSELYSAWKRWMEVTTNHKYESAFRVVGGDPTVAGGFLGSTFFLTNNWRIRPYEGNHFLSLEGNIYVEEGGNPFVTTTGSYNVVCSIERSNLVDFQVVSESSFTPTDRDTLGEVISSIESTTVGVLSGAIDRVQTDCTAEDGVYNNMTILVQANGCNISRKIQSYTKTQGTFFFDQDLPDTPPSGSVCIVKTDYQNNRAGRIS